MTNQAADQIHVTNITTIAKRKNPSKRLHVGTAAAATTTAILDVEDRWLPVEGWSIADRAQEEGSAAPLLTSPKCYRGLVSFFQGAYGDPIDTTLAMATESSSHPAGLLSLYGQPWVWAGGGLGNMDECPLQVCLAGGTGRDSLTFASACVVGECSASDLLAQDFVERLETASFRADHPNDAHDYDPNVIDLVHEYVTLHRRIAEVGKFLGTGWVCGEYKVDWEMGPSVLWLTSMTICFVLSFVGTFGRRTDNSSRNQVCAEQDKVKDSMELCPFLEEHREQKPDRSNFVQLDATATFTSSHQESTSLFSTHFWSAWNMATHCRRLVESRPETSSLDGLKVASILWIIAAHVMAIQSSTGAGYLNPKDFLPPLGVTTTLFGQLLFSSRYAVDTFLCISGYLAVYVLQRKLKDQSTKATTTLQVMGVLAMRILRILPLYVMCLGFWMFLAPHFGSGGPFWYQWENFLQPCRDSWWTNLIFVNNFLPWGVSTTANCFYHSWYLAVDVQLFFLFAPWLTLLFHRSHSVARNVTIVLWTSSVVVTAVLSYTQEWSVNTFDGAAVAVFDVEGYAKPHVRAQSYLAGILVAMWPRSRRRERDPDKVCRSESSECDKYRSLFFSRTKKGKENASNERYRPFWTMLRLLVTSDTCLMALALAGLVILSFVTVTGAYVRRACTFEELPGANNCGSIWSPLATFLYTAFSRAIWSICIAVIIHLCVEERGDGSITCDDGPFKVNQGSSASEDGSSSDSSSQDTMHIDTSRALGHCSRPGQPVSAPRKKSLLVLIVRSILSCTVFTPLAHLSFGAYLIHPIIIFIWTLGGREKVTFRLLTFMMDYFSTTVVTFFLSFVASLVVEFPFGVLLRPQQQRMRQRTSTRNGGLVDDRIATASMHERTSTSPMSTSDGGREMGSLWDSDPSTNTHYGAVRVTNG
jgi:peptidoglycan/LPS O-acetylase OafA/YrhL